VHIVWLLYQQSLPREYLEDVALGVVIGFDFGAIEDHECLIVVIRQIGHESVVVAGQRTVSPLVLLTIIPSLAARAP